MTESNLPQSIVYRPLRDERFYEVSAENGVLSVVRGSVRTLTASLLSRDSEVALTLSSDSSLSETDLSLMTALEFLFGHTPSLQRVSLVTPDNSLALSMSRADFFQRPHLWLHVHPESVGEASEEWTETNGRKHPVRPKTIQATYYRRYVPAIGKTVSFRTIEIERDLEKFHEWHNKPRVADLWELAKPIGELEEYLKKGLQDPHSIPMIVEFDGEAAGYFEMYWTAEDRLAPYYDYLAYDRGFHFLIGEEKFLGVPNTDAVLRSVSHFLFLDNARTEHVLGEPRADNKRVLKYVESVPGWRFVKEFDFPHKRAALLCAKREEYFGEGAL